MQDIGFTTVLTALASRVSREFREIPGLRLNSRQAARLFGVAQPIAESTLNELHQTSFLSRSDNGSYFLNR